MDRGGVVPATSPDNDNEEASQALGELPSPPASPQKIPATLPSTRPEDADTQPPDEDVAINVSIFPLPAQALTPVKGTQDGKCSPQKAKVCPWAPKKKSITGYMGGVQVNMHVRTQKNLRFDDDNKEDQEAYEDVELDSLNTQQLHKLHEEVQREAKEIQEKYDHIERKRARTEEEHDKDPPLTQRYYQQPEQGPVRMDPKRRYRLNIENEPWRVEHGTEGEQQYRSPSIRLSDLSLDTQETGFVLPMCCECKESSAKTVIVNCGHSIYCISCAAHKKPLKCRLCNTLISRIVPIMNS